MEEYKQKVSEAKQQAESVAMLTTELKEAFLKVHL